MTVWIVSISQILQILLSFASANSRHCFHFWCGKCRLKNVQHSLYGFAFRSTPPFHRHSVFIQCYLFYVHHREKPSNHFTPVVVTILPIESSSSLSLEKRKKLFFLGILNDEYNSFLASAIYHFQFSIWEEKLGKRSPAFITLCATDFSLLNLPKGKSLGRSKPATNS